MVASDERRKQDPPWTDPRTPPENDLSEEQKQRLRRMTKMFVRKYRKALDALEKA